MMIGKKKKFAYQDTHTPLVIAQKYFRLYPEKVWNISNNEREPKFFKLKNIGNFKVLFEKAWKVCYMLKLGKDEKIAKQEQEQENTKIEKREELELRSKKIEVWLESV